MSTLMYDLVTSRGKDSCDVHKSKSVFFCHSAHFRSSYFTCLYVHNKKYLLLTDRASESARAKNRTPRRIRALSIARVFFFFFLEMVQCVHIVRTIRRANHLNAIKRLVDARSIEAHTRPADLVQEVSLSHTFDLLGCRRVVRGSFTTSLHLRNKREKKNNNIE